MGTLTLVFLLNTNWKMQHELWSLNNFSAFLETSRLPRAWEIARPSWKLKELRRKWAGYACWVFCFGFWAKVSGNWSWTPAYVAKEGLEILILLPVSRVLQLQACANLFYRKGQFSTVGQKQEHWAARKAKLRAQGCRGKLGLDFNALRHEALKKYGSSQLTSPLLLRDVFPFLVNCPVSRVYFVVSIQSNGNTAETKTKYTKDLLCPCFLNSVKLHFL